MKCLATLGIMVPFCHSTFNGSLPPCSFVSLLSSRLPAGCGALGLFPPLHGLPTGCSSTGMSLLRHGSPSSHGTSWVSLLCCGSPFVTSTWWFMAYSHTGYHFNSFLLMPCHFWPLKTGVANGKTVRVTWSWLATRLKSEK